MPGQHGTSKLRRGTVEPAMPKTASNETHFSWNGFDLEKLGQVLSSKHVPKSVWKTLAGTLSFFLEDEAIALVHFKSDGMTEILAEDGLHDALRLVLCMKSPHSASCPFMAAPGAPVIDLLDGLDPRSELRSIYEFIQHYWGWALGDESYPVYLMLFGAVRSAPTQASEDAAMLCRYVAWHLATEKRRQQLMSDLSAEIQGLRITPSHALHANIESWVNKNARPR